MRPTSTSQIAKWFNQQRPLDKRESTQLLKSLTSSFRKHLDREYPIGPTESAIQKDETTQTHTVSQRPSAHVTTSNHLGMLLANPVISGTRKQQAGTLQEELLQQDPERSFRKRMSAGDMTFSTASVFLKMRLARKAQDPWRSFDAGSRVLSWLRSTGWLETTRFFQDTSFTVLLVANLVLERQDSLLKQWCHPKVLGLVESKHISQDILVAWMRKVSKTFVVRSIHRDGLEPGISLLLELLDVKFDDGKTKNHIFSAATYGTLWQVGMASKEKLKSVVSYDKLMGHVAGSRPFLSFLEVHHPTHPRFENALEEIKSRRITSTSVSNQGQERYNFTLLISTARGLVEQHIYDKAAQVLLQLHDKYPEKVSMADVKAISVLADQQSPQPEPPRLQQLLVSLREAEVEFLQWHTTQSQQRGIDMLGRNTLEGLALDDPS